MAKRSSLLQIAHTLHSARMATYLGSAHNDVARALDLYRWNLQLGAAFQEVLAVTEITLRNAVDHALRTWNAGQPRPTVKDCTPRTGSRTPPARSPH